MRDGRMEVLKGTIQISRSSQGHLNSYALFHALIYDELFSAAKKKKSLMSPGSFPTFDRRKMKTPDKTRLQLNVVCASDPSNMVAEAGGL